MNWEDVSFVRKKEDIEEQNQEWIKNHFTNYSKKNNIMQITGNKIKITVRETMIAIDKMGKNKAAAADELTDTIF